MLGFKSVKAAYATLKGIEVIRMIANFNVFFSSPALPLKRHSSTSCSASGLERAGYLQQSRWDSVAIDK
jgi:hypothetical protein